MKKINVISYGILVMLSLILINCSKKQESPLPPQPPTSLTPPSTPIVSIDSNQIIFHNLKFICPMGCTITIDPLYNYITPSAPILVFLKKASDVNWIPVPPIAQVANYNSFSYQIFSYRELVVYTESDIGNNEIYEVKITF